MKEERGSLQQEVHGDQNAISMYGDARVDVSTHIHPPPIPSELPERVWMIPYRRNAFFTGREHVLTRLHECFTRNREAVLTQGQAINGLGGIGKTQVAVEYAYRYREEYRFVLWANASTTQTLFSAYISIADRLQLLERTIQDQKKIVNAVLHWLATHEHWLLILDNADELEQVWPLLPTGSTGHVLLTTRDQLVRDMEKFPVEEMNYAEGSLLLLRRAHLLKLEMEREQVSQEDLQIAKQIVEEMGGLPLALDQAGAYIEETMCSLAVYQRRYQQQRRVFLQRRGRNGGTYPSSVATTWSLSFERVEQKNPLAANLLRLCAYLAPDAIPNAIIMQGGTFLKEDPGSGIEDQGYFGEAVGVLRAYSLISRDTQKNMWSIHRLVQLVIRDSMTEEMQKTWKLRLANVLCAACPNVSDIKEWKNCEEWLPHAEVLDAKVLADWVDEAGAMLHGGKYISLAYIQQAIYVQHMRNQYLQYRLNHISQMDKDMETLVNSLGNEKKLGAKDLEKLASLYQDQEKYEQLGPEHPLIKLARENHALLLKVMERDKHARAQDREENHREQSQIPQPIEINYLKTRRDRYNDKRNR